ncbi:MAG: sugar transferase [Eubacterium sp.]
MNNRRKIQKILEFWTGLIALIASNGIGIFFFYYTVKKIGEYSVRNWIEYWFVLLLSYFIVFISFSSPINLLKRSKPMEIASTLRNCTLIYAAFAVLLILTKNYIFESRYLFLGSFILFTFLSLLFRYILKRLLIKHFSSSKIATITGIITTTDRADDFITSLKADWSKNIKAVALIDTVFENNSYKYEYSYKQKNGKNSVITKTRLKTIDEVDGIPVVANADNLLGWIRTASLDEVYINLSNYNQIDIASLIEELEDMGITVNINLPSLETIVENSKFDNINCIVKAGYPMAVFSPTVHNSTQLFIKRIIDIIGGIVGSIISLPIILITAIPLLIESPGPLIFKQQRVGKNGRVFNIYKLRSMYVDAEERKKELMEKNKMNGFMFKMDDDPRITKVGRIIRKLSIDELPQFWNVVKGDMSLVGTRPPTVDEFEKYESHHKRRLSMSPGITGMWQVSGRSDIQDFEEVVRLDCEYIDNWSLWLDIKILFKTVGVVLKGSGAE